MTADLFPRLVQRHAVPGDQVGEHAGGGARHPQMAVDQHLRIVHIMSVTESTEMTPCPVYRYLLQIVTPHLAAPGHAVVYECHHLMAQFRYIMWTVRCVQVLTSGKCLLMSVWSTSSSRRPL